MNWVKIIKNLFGRTRKHCSFCGKHHNEVAKLVAGDGVSICNECVLVCSGVLMKECAEYRCCLLDQMRDLPEAAGKPEPKTAPHGDPAMPPGNSEATRTPPAVS